MSLAARNRITKFLVFLGISAQILVACATPQQTPIDPVRAQIARGAPVYARDCATEQCHGVMGEGLRQGDSFRVWPLVGEPFEARNPNAQVIFDVVRSGGEANLRALSDQQIYDAIAYELTTNGVSLAAPLTAENAAEVASGPSSPAARWGDLYPPPGNAFLLSPPPAPRSPTRVSNSYLSLRVDQLALASQLGGSIPSDGGAFVILVLAFQNLGVENITVEPAYLSLIDSKDQAHTLVPVRLEYPIETFHRQTISPEHGTAAVAVFGLPPGSWAALLVYDDRMGAHNTINLQE